MHEFYQYSPRSKVSAGLAVYDCGMEECLPLHSFGPAKRSYYLIHYIVSGKGIYRVGEKTYHLKAGDLFLIRPGDVTFYRADPDEPWSYYWVGFLGSEADGMVTGAGFDESPIVHCENDHLLKKHMSDMGFLTPSARARDCAVLGYLYLIFSCLIEQNSPDEEWSRARYAAENAAAFIHKNYADNISVSSIAEHLDLDRSYLYRVFKAHMKTSPMEYLTHVRLLNACIALRDTDMRICEVAYSVGFRDLSHFSKIFKKKYLTSPSKYRACRDTTAILLEDAAEDILPDMD